MISPKCDICKEELNEYGALMFSPPDEEGNVKKFHICKNCYVKNFKIFEHTQNLKNSDV